MNFEVISKQAETQFAECRDLLVAIGDETRQAIITALIGSNCEGMRVGDITNKTHISRPAVSHHLGILLRSEVIGVIHNGTKNFYYLKLGGAWETLVNLIENIENLRANSP
jgi:ArsR family transcriptional regulator